MVETVVNFQKVNEMVFFFNKIFFSPFCLGVYLPESGTRVLFAGSFHQSMY